MLYLRVPQGHTHIFTRMRISSESDRHSSKTDKKMRRHPSCFGNERVHVYLRNRDRTITLILMGYIAIGGQFVFITSSTTAQSDLRDSLSINLPNRVIYIRGQLVFL